VRPQRHTARRTPRGTQRSSQPDGSTVSRAQMAAPSLAPGRQHRPPRTDGSTVPRAPMSAHHGAHRPRRGAPGPATTRQRTQGLQPHLATGRASQTLVCPDLTRAEDQRLAPETTNPGPRAQPPRSTLPRRDPCRGPATCAKDSRSRSPRPAAAHHPARRPPGRQQSPGTARGPGTPWSRSQVKMETPERLYCS